MLIDYIQSSSCIPRRAYLSKKQAENSKRSETCFLTETKSPIM